MSAAARTAIATAASTVPDVTCEPYYKQALKPGSACVRFAGSAPADNGYGRISTWQVWLALPQQVAHAEVWIDEHMDALAEALDREFIAGVQRILPAELSFPGSNPINGLIVEGNREE